MKLWFRRGGSRGGSLSVVLLGVLLGILPRHAGAVGTRTFHLDSLEDFSSGDLKGVAVGSDGIVRTGWMLGSTPLDGAQAVFSALPVDGGAVLVGTSPGGKVLRVQGDQVSTFAETGELAVTSLVQGPGSVVFAATMPSGKIYKVEGGRVSVLATLPGAEHVWALALDKARTALFAATGPEGKLFRVGFDGSSSVYFDSDEPHLVSVAVDEQGNVHTGSSGKALLYKVTGPGRATLTDDLPGDEVKAVAVGKGGVLWAIANDYEEPPEPPKRNANQPRSAAGPTTAPRPKPGKGVLLRYDAQGRPERMMRHDEFHYMSLALDETGAPFVGTGNEGRIYTVNDAHAVTLVVDTDERQVGAVLFRPGALPFVASGDPAVAHRVLSQGGSEAVWTSKTLDAGLRAHFGRVVWQGTGTLEVSTRTGATQTPDTTWSPWSTPLRGAPGGGGSGAISSPPGRWVQVRARWAADRNATLSDLLLPFVTDNVRPVVTEVTAQQKSAAKDSKEGAAASGGDPPKHDSVVHVTWKVDNPDNDALRYRLAFRREEQGPKALWRDVQRSEEVVTKTEYDWDTQALPEGRYRVRVEASDEVANPPEQVQRHALESAAMLVDNTPPIVTSLTVQGGRLKAKVVDGVGPIARIEVALDGRPEWRPLAPVDGVFDSAEEIVDVDLASLLAAAGASGATTSHIVALRAYDSAGNTVVRELETR